MDKEIELRSIDRVRDEMDQAVVEAGAAAGPGGFSFQEVGFKERHAPEGLPLTLVLRDVLQHSGRLSTRSRSLDLVVSEPILEMHEADAARAGLSNNGHARVVSEKGEVYLKVRVADEVMEGTVYTSAHFPQGNVNLLTDANPDGSSEPTFVRVEPA